MRAFELERKTGKRNVRVGEYVRMQLDDTDNW